MQDTMSSIDLAHRRVIRLLTVQVLKTVIMKAKVMVTDLDRGSDDVFLWSECLASSIM